MHGRREGDELRTLLRRRHMWSVPPPVPLPASPSSVAVPESAAAAAVISPDSFSKVNIHECVRAYMCSFKFVAIVYKLVREF